MVVDPGPVKADVSRETRPGASRHVVGGSGRIRLPSRKAVEARGSDMFHVKQVAVWVTCCHVIALCACDGATSERPDRPAVAEPAPAPSRALILEAADRREASDL